MKASFLVIFPLVRTNRKKKRADRIMNILDMAKGEKLEIWTGWIRATIPKTKVDGTMTAPIRLPRIILVWPFLADIMAK